MIKTKLTIGLLFLITLNSCSTHQYHDLSHYGLLEYEGETSCKRDSQCRVIGYGIGNSCGPTWEGGVAGYIIYSSAIGRENITHLKKLAKHSKINGEDNQFDYSRLQLEECLPAQRSKPMPRCIEDQCE